MKNTKLNLVVKTKDGAKASKIVGLLSKFLKSVDIPCRFELPNDESIQIGKDKPLFTFIFHSTAFFWKGLSELNIGRAYIEGKFDLKGDVVAFLSLRKLIKLTSSYFLINLFVVDKINYNIKKNNLFY